MSTRQNFQLFHIWQADCAIACIVDFSGPRAGLMLLLHFFFLPHMPTKCTNYCTNNTTNNPHCSNNSCDSRTSWILFFGGSHRVVYLLPFLVEHSLTVSHLQIWASKVLVTHPILQIWSRWTATLSLDWKRIEMLPFFCPTRRSLLPRGPGWRTNFWIFFEWLANVRATG